MGEILSYVCLQLAANIPLQPPDSLMCYFSLTPKPTIVWTCSSVMIVCLKVGLPTLKVWFSLCSWVFLLTYHGHFWTWISAGIRRKEWAWFVLLSPCQIWWLVLYPSPLGSSLLAISFRSGTTRETLILVAWPRFLTSHTSLPLVHYMNISFPHISHLGPHLSIGSTRS